MHDVKTMFARKAVGISIPPRFPLKSAFNICAPTESALDHVNAIIESPISGLISSSSKVYETLYKVPLKHGIPNAQDKSLDRDGHSVCVSMCGRVW